MADRVSIAIRQEQALNRLIAAMGTFAERHGVAAVDIPTRGRDPELLRAEQFEALAGWLEQAVSANEGAATVPSDTSTDSDFAPQSDYNGMTKAELVFEAQRRKIDVSGMKTRAEVIDALQASDGLTEDEQAALDKGAGAGQQAEA